MVVKLIHWSWWATKAGKRKKKQQFERIKEERQKYIPNSRLPTVHMCMGSKVRLLSRKIVKGLEAIGTAVEICW